MSDYKEFTGKNLDDAIQAACSHYTLDRNKLELEIVSGGSSGIFGLVGKKKAVVRARPLEAANLMAEPKPEPKKKSKPKPRAKTEPKEPAAAEAAPESQPQAPEAKADGEPDDSAGDTPVKPKRKRSRSRKPKAKTDADGNANGNVDGNGNGDGEQAGPQAANGECENGDKPAKRKRRRRKPKKPAPHNGEPGNVQAANGSDAYSELDESEPDDNIGNRLEPENGGPGHSVMSTEPTEPQGPAEPEVAEEEVPLDDPELEAYLHKAVSLMAEPIVGEVTITMSRTSDRIRVHVAQADTDAQTEDAPQAPLAPEDGPEPGNELETGADADNGADTNGEEKRDFAGLLIGRDGQNLSAMQYLLNRMVGKQWPEAPKVQLDAGDYRERLDDKLRKMAHFLAGKAQDTGKVQSTKPLSSYHRRVVHLALQNQDTITTRSKGDGPMKRVLILPKRKK